MTKVLYFIETLYQGGAETLVKDYALLLDKSMFSVVVVCLRRTGSSYEGLLKDNGIRVIYVSDFFGSYQTFFGRLKNKAARMAGLYHIFLRKIITSESPDVIHAHLAVLRFLKFADIKKNIKLLYTVHSEPKKYWHGKTRCSSCEYKACHQLIKNKNMQLIALHDAMRNEVNQLFNVSNTIVINNGIDFTKFENALSKEIVRSKLQISKEAFVIGHIGRFAEPKNHRFIVDVFVETLKKNPNAFLLLVGSGPLLAEIKSKVSKFNIEDHVMFLTNRIDVPDLMNAMDVFIFPSVYEGLGIVLIEAQKMGLPCVISDDVPSAASVSNLTLAKSLQATPEEWADSLLNFKVGKVIYKNLNNWDMNLVVQQLEQLYLG
ncbi:MAG: glycosyltransferase [Candidatus Saccharibacteria bacterium]|nr:glycosyltransferase [Candidatus Saccharibacteria bacterium]